MLVEQSRLKNLRTLYLSNTEIDDSAADYIAQLTSLQTLWIGHTNVGDRFITGISSLRNLEDLNVTGTQITNVPESAICGFPKLEHFYASDTSMDYDTIRRINAYVDANKLVELDRITKQ
ncbi:MAG: leucine-rich repeat domain-containing protein [Planctomycetes bacterium]|nr:leucine-rich repeat domain-containing protein [Planctomycetota bacterium]